MPSSFRLSTLLSLLALVSCGEEEELLPIASTSPSVTVTMPGLKLPFRAGEAWVLTRGYNTETHRDYGSLWVDDRYALDFVETGCTSWRKPILAAADGVVELWHNQAGGYGNNILIDHGGGWKTRYAHMDELSVVDGQQVLQGQEVGKAGNSGNVTGVACPQHPGLHLHFVLYKDGKGMPPDPISGFTGLKPGPTYRSDNPVAIAPYVFNPAGNPYTCSNEPVGGANTNWVYTCTKKDSFTAGESAWGLLRLDKVTKNHCLKSRFLKNQVVQFDSSVWCNTSVEPWGWDKAFFWPMLNTFNSGTWTVQYFVDVGRGFPEKPLATATLTVKAGQPYTYNLNGYTCSTPPQGGANTNWFYTCTPVSTFSFFTHPTVYGLLSVENIFKNFKFVTKFYKDGVYRWTDEPFNYTVVEPWTWRYAFAFPQINQPEPGNWKIEVYLAFADGTPTTKLKDLSFTVVP